MRKFYLVSGIGWEFPNLEATHQEFLIRASWSIVPNEKCLAAALEPLSEREQSRVDMVRAWAANHEDTLRTEALLTPANIDYFFVMLDCLKVKGRLFP